MPRRTMPLMSDRSVLSVPGLPGPSECVREAEDLLDSAHRNLPCDALAELLLAVRALIAPLRRNELPSYPVELLLSRAGVSPAARAYLRPVEWLVRALADHPADPVYLERAAERLDAYLDEVAARPRGVALP